MEAEDAIFLTLKKVATACTTEEPQVPKTHATEEQLYAYNTCAESNFICKNLILNGLIDKLYDYYSTMSTVKEVWDCTTKEVRH